jgi:hypothetical protein
LCVLGHVWGLWAMGPYRYGGGHGTQLASLGGLLTPSTI